MISKQQIENFKGRKEYLKRRIELADDKEALERQLYALYLEERVAYSDDLIQPGDPRFQTLYRNEWIKNERELEEAKLKKKRIAMEQNKFYKDNLHEGRDKVKNALNLEDKIRYEGNK